MRELFFRFFLGLFEADFDFEAMYGRQWSWDALDENYRIVVDEITGTSAGAMTGVVYSAGLDSDFAPRHFRVPCGRVGSSVTSFAATTGSCSTSTAAFATS